MIDPGCGGHFDIRMAAGHKNDTKKETKSMGNVINTEYGQHSYITEETQRIKDFTEAAGHIFSENMIQDMAEQGFFTCPASLSSHGDHIGGLYDHSMCVYRYLQQFTQKLDLTWQRPESPLLVAIFHDWVKLQNFVVNDDGDGAPEYVHNPHKLLIGHGEVSVILAQQFLQDHIRAPKLTQEEIACIRYHMGAFTDKKEWDYYTQAIRSYPNVLWTHTADMVASQINGI